MMFIEIVFKALTMAGVCSFLIIVGRKTGAFNYLQGRTPRWMPWGCDFCLGFWFSCLLSILAFTIWLPFTWPMVLVPILSTAFNNTLLKW